MTGVDKLPVDKLPVYARKLVQGSFICFKFILKT
jgi:hypothetical protein